MIMIMSMIMIITIIIITILIIITISMIIMSRPWLGTSFSRLKVRPLRRPGMPYYYYNY